MGAVGYLTSTAIGTVLFVATSRSSEYEVNELSHDTEEVLARSDVSTVEQLAAAERCLLRTLKRIPQ